MAGDLLDAPLRDFLDTLSGEGPAPGGGSAAAIVVAMAAGLVTMVARASKDHWDEAGGVVGQAETFRARVAPLAQADADAYLVALNIAQQLTRRVAYKKAMKQSIQRSMKAGAKGVRIALAGRLGGSEMGRREWDREGRIPLGTLRADISYGQVHAHTTYGRIGVKVWIYRGDITPERAARDAGVPTAVGTGV